MSHYLFLISCGNGGKQAQQKDVLDSDISKHPTPHQNLLRSRHDQRKGIDIHLFLATAGCGPTYLCPNTATTTALGQELNLQKRPDMQSKGL
jgi:hypothetical protein